MEIAGGEPVRAFWLSSARCTRAGRASCPDALATLLADFEPEATMTGQYSSDGDCGDGPFFSRAMSPPPIGPLSIPTARVVGP